MTTKPPPTGCRLTGKNMEIESVGKPKDAILSHLS